MANKEGEMKEETNVSLPGNEDIDFEPISEPWSRYRLQDGTIFEIRLILTNINPDPVNQYNYKFNSVGRVINSKSKLQN